MTEIVLLLFIIVIICAYMISLLKRSALLGIFTTIYIAPGIVLAVNAIDESTKFSYWTPELQISEVSTIAVGIVTVGLLGLVLGYAFHFRFGWLQKKISVFEQITKYECFLWGVLALLSIQEGMPGTTFFQVPYGQTGWAGTLGNIRVFTLTGNMIIFMLFVNALYRKSLYRVLWVGTLYLIGVFYLQFLGGHRVEGLGLTIAVVFYWLFVMRHNISKLSSGIIGTMKLKCFRRRRNCLYVILGVSLIFLWIVGVWRNTGGVDMPLSKIVKQSFSTFATFGDIAQTLSLTTAIVKKGILLYGGTYLNYILSTLPTSITPNRPEHMAWQLGRLGSRVGHPGMGGGIYIAAVGFINFGWLGTFLGMFMIGVFLSTVETSARRSNANIISLAEVLYGLIFVGIFRWIYYGGQSMYKLILVTIILIVSMKVIHEVFVGSLKRR